MFKHGQDKYYQLFSYIKFLTEFWIKIILKVFVSILIKSFTYGFNDNISNVFSGLSISYNSSINIILIPCWINFNC